VTGKEFMYVNLNEQVGGMKSLEFIRETIISFIFVIAG
jgi:hypothetical protein